MGKVLIYILTEGKGGVEEYVMNLSRFCDNPSSRYGYLIMGDKTVYEDELKTLGVDYYFLPPKNKLFSNIKAYWELLNKLRTEYDTIYFNTSGLYYPIPYLFAKKYNYKIVLHSHLTNGPALKKPIHYINRRWINKACSVKLACSAPAGRWMFGNKEKFTIIPNAIELDRFCFDDSNRSKCREQYHLGDSFVIGNIGRLHQVKNQVFLVDILKALVDKGVDAKLLLVGDGEMRQSIEKHAEEAEVREKIVFAGQSNFPEYFYSAMDCFAMPSFVEGFPITLIEAQANGLQCVVSDSVTNETNVTGHVAFVNLSQKSSWVDAIAASRDRYVVLDSMKKKGFDIRDLTDNVYSIITCRNMVNYD